MKSKQSKEKDASETFICLGLWMLRHQTCTFSPVSIYPNNTNTKQQQKRFKPPKKSHPNRKPKPNQNTQLFLHKASLVIYRITCGFNPRTKCRNGHCQRTSLGTNVGLQRAGWKTQQRQRRKTKTEIEKKNMPKNFCSSFNYHLKRTYTAINLKCAIAFCRAPRYNVLLLFRPR